MSGPARLPALAGLALAACLYATAGWPQALDCNRLAAQIAAASQGGSAGRYVAAAQKQRGEIARMSAYAQSLGCDRPQFLFFGNRPPQCDGLNAQIARMQANLQGLSQAGGGNGRAHPPGTFRRELPRHGRLRNRTLLLRTAVRHQPAGTPRPVAGRWHSADHARDGRGG